MINLEQVEKVKSVTANFILNNQESFLFLCGETGYGKTTAIRELIEDAGRLKIENYMAYLHIPVACNSQAFYQALLFALGMPLTKRCTNFEMVKPLERIIIDIQEANGKAPVFVLDDANNLLFANWQNIIETLKQLVEVTDAKFVFLSTADLIPFMPLNISRRSQSFQLESA